MRVTSATEAFRNQAYRAKLLYMRRLIVVLLLSLVVCLPSFAQKLSVYAIDVEGGKAMLIVTPEKESLLVDAGWPNNTRDVERILAATKDAGVSKIDYLLVTHYHVDHVGGVPAVIEKIPVGHVIDHGANVEHSRYTEKLYDEYQKTTAKIPHITVKPGDKLPLKGVQIDIVAAAGEAIKPAKAGLPQNPLCNGLVAKAPENDENDQSVGFILRFGKFQMVDLTDLTAGKEPMLFCPSNLLGTVPVLMVSHHGFDRSTSPLLLGSLKPRVAIMNNGQKKGGDESVVKSIYASPGLEAMWVLHGGPGMGAVPEKFDANPEADCKGYGIKLVAEKNGWFTILNLRNNYSVTYPAK